MVLPYTAVMMQITKISGKECRIKPDKELEHSSARWRWLRKHISSFLKTITVSAETGVNYDDAQKITESIGNRTDDQFFQHLFRNGSF